MKPTIETRFSETRFAERQFSQKWPATGCRLVAVLVLVLAAVPAYPRGTPEETWKPVTGEEVWRHEFELGDLSPGMHNVIVRARDVAGNEAIEGPFNVRVDPAVGLPTVRVIYPERGAVVRDDVTMIGVASASGGVSRVEVRLGDRAPTVAEGTDYWGTTIPTGNLPDGTYTLYARAVGNGATEGRAVGIPIILDRSPPRVRITSHQSGALVSGTVTFEGVADDANGIRSLELSTDGGVTFEPLRLHGSRGETTVRFSFSVQTRRISDGATVYYLRAVDATGATAVHPVLFFVDNEPPTLEVLSPQFDAEVHGRVQVRGFVRDTVGVQRLFSEWDREEHEIQLRAGDPYWTTEIDITGNRSRTIAVRFTAVDFSGNSTTVVQRLQNDPDALLPAITVVHPPAHETALLGWDDAIYGHVSGSDEVQSVIVEGALDGEFPAGPAFRIPASDIPTGRGELRIRGRLADGTIGEPLRLRVVRMADAEGFEPPLPSRVNVHSVSAHQYVTGALELAGSVDDSGRATRLEYRLSPEKPWHSIALESGAFSSRVSLAAQPAGPLHLELRTVRAGNADHPLYLPLNHAPSPPDIRVVTPRPSDVINGLTTVSGAVCSQAPITELSYSLDGQEFRQLRPQSSCDGNAFSFTVDFTALEDAGGRLQLRAVDAAGNTRTVSPVVRVDRTADLPIVELHLPRDGQVITENFALSGMAFDDDGVAAVHWRVGDREFQRITATQTFRIEVPLDSLASGEQTIEVYAEDIYGLEGELVQLTVMVSTDRPHIDILQPQMDSHSRGTMTIRGTASDLNGIKSVRLSLDNGNTFQLAEGTEEWSLSVNTESYLDGTYSVLAVATDTLGVESRTTALVSIDNTRPEITVAQPLDGELVGGTLRLSGRVYDNIGVESLQLELTPVSEGTEPLVIELDSQSVLLEDIDVSEMSPGSYNLHLSATDLAGNRSVVARRIELGRSAASYSVRLHNPMPGVQHTGPVTVAGRITGPTLPARVQLFDRDTLLADVDVDRNGFFRHTLSEAVTRGSRMAIVARFNTPSGDTVSSPAHTLLLERWGPVVTIDSHRSGDTVTGRPWLKGTAWIEPTPQELAAAEERRSRESRRALEPERVLVSLDNGRTFAAARGGAEWQFRLESAELARGPLPVLVRAEFGDGRIAVQRVLLIVDTAAPSLSVLAPDEGSRHADSLTIYGTAADEYGIDSIEVALRPGDKSGYAVPQFVQGLYLDTHFFGATYADMGLGISFFDDNVKVQVQAGVAPPGRFTGTVIGTKLLANVAVVPFDYFLGPDWAFFSMAFALGANFSYFTMDDEDGLVMSAVLAQWEFARLQMEQWRAFRTLSLYLEPNLWFAASDVEAGAVFRMSLGFRAGLL